MGVPYLDKRGENLPFLADHFRALPGGFVYHMLWLATKVVITMS